MPNRSCRPPAPSGVPVTHHLHARGGLREQDVQAKLKPGIRSVTEWREISPLTTCWVNQVLPLSSSCKRLTWQINDANTIATSFHHTNNREKKSFPVLKEAVLAQYQACAEHGSTCKLAWGIHCLCSDESRLAMAATADQEAPDSWASSSTSRCQMTCNHAGGPAPRWRADTRQAMHVMLPWHHHIVHGWQEVEETIVNQWRMTCQECLWACITAHAAALV
jgi:hypothetical protein